MQVDQADIVVVGGGPAGATAAADLAQEGYQVALIDKGGRIKPCGGAIPPKLVRDFDIPQSQLVAHVHSARIISPTQKHVDMHINGGYVGMVDRKHFDPWLRERAQQFGARLHYGKYVGLTRESDGQVLVSFEQHSENATAPKVLRQIRARLVIGADGARSKVARECYQGEDPVSYVSAYHEIVSAPANNANYDATRCDVFYDGRLSPDFYAWVFPHGDTASVGVGTARKGAPMRAAVSQLREMTGLSDARTVRREGAPIPMKPRARWDNARDVLLAGDAAGVVAPSSGEGIYYAMLSGRLAAQSAAQFIQTSNVKALGIARKQFMKNHREVFMMLGLMQNFWYANDNRRERFVKICKDPDVQDLTWDAYMNKELVKAKPLAHARIFFKNMAHLTGLAPV
jgi:geranylgeranyl reductase